MEKSVLVAADCRCGATCFNGSAAVVSEQRADFGFERKHLASDVGVGESWSIFDIN